MKDDELILSLIIRFFGDDPERDKALDSSKLKVRKGTMLKGEPVTIVDINGVADLESLEGFHLFEGKPPMDTMDTVVSIMAYCDNYWGPLPSEFLDTLLLAHRLVGRNAKFNLTVHVPGETPEQGAGQKS